AVVLIPDGLLAGPGRGGQAALTAAPEAREPDEDGQINGRGTLYRASVGSPAAIAAVPDAGEPVEVEAVEVGLAEGVQSGVQARTDAAVLPQPRPKHARQEVIE